MTRRCFEQTPISRPCNRAPNSNPYALLVHRLSALLIPLRRLLLLLPALRWSSLHRYILPATTTIHHLLYIWSILEVLSELADMAIDFMPRLEGEWNDWDETECEPLPVAVLATRYGILAWIEVCKPSLRYLRREVTAVLALRCDVFVW